MTETHRVLCVSDDDGFRRRIATSLDGAHPAVRVVAEPDFDAAVDSIATDAVDCVVADDRTARKAPAIVRAVAERHPDLPMLVLSRFDPDTVAVAEVVDYLDGVDDADLAGWVANSVVRDRSGVAPPVGGRPEEVAREIKRALVDATSPADIETAVCETLTAGDQYTFAWVGEYDRGESEVVPLVAGAGVDDWPIAATFPVGDDDCPLDAALRTGETQVVAVDSPETIPWESVARRHGCTATAVVPLSENGDLYGVLGVYTGSPDGFDEAEIDAIEDVAGTVSNVLHGIALQGRVEQNERELDRYERLVETVADGMYVLDAGGHFMTVNSALCSMTGYSREGLLGEHVSLVLEDVEDVESILADSDDGTATVEVILRTKDGREIPCENRLAIMKGDGGTVGAVRDITDRKRRERELRKQNERLEAFAEIVSHDLRNPLSVAQGYLDLLSGDDDTIEKIGSSLERMESIIGDVLALARHGQSVTKPDEIDLREVIEEAWRHVDTAEATIVFTFRERPIIADRSRLLRLLENLFRNAVEHAGDDVTVTVGLTDDGFYVADDGSGMPVELRETAFDSSVSTVEGGHGLGLWVVREVAEAHGWSVTATESESNGARFEFTDVY